MAAVAAVVASRHKHRDGGGNEEREGGWAMRLALVAADTWRVDVSPGGVGWLRGTATVSKTFTPIHVGLLASSWGTATKHVTSYDFIRRLSGVN